MGDLACVRGVLSDLGSFYLSNRERAARRRAAELSENGIGFALRNRVLRGKREAISKKSDTLPDDSAPGAEAQA